MTLKYQNRARNVRKMLALKASAGETWTTVIHLKQQNSIINY